MADEVKTNTQETKVPVTEPAPIVDPNKDQLIAGKFKTQEDLVKAYKELESKLGSKGKEQTPAATEQTKTVEPAKATEQPKDPEAVVETAKQVVEGAGLDFDALAQEYYDNGDLTEDSYKTLESKGIPKAVVETYMNGLKALAKETEQQMYANVGGKENYVNVILPWAKTTLSKEEATKFDKMLTSGDMDKIEAAMYMLNERFVKANGSPPKQLVSGSVTTVGDVFATRAEHLQAVRDPRYRTDPVYREQVIKKAERSNYEQ